MPSGDYKRLRVLNVPKGYWEIKDDKMRREGGRDRKRKRNKERQRKKRWEWGQLCAREQSSSRREGEKIKNLY